MNSDSTANVVPFPSTQVDRGTDPTMTDVALQVLAKSVEKWGPNQAVDLELRSIVTIGFSMAESKYIEPDHFVSELRRAILPGPDSGASELFDTMVEQGRSFWDIVHQPFLGRDLNRTQVREIISQGLPAARGSYRRMSVLFNIRPDHYQKFMDFLRHHRLKPEE
jgi:hypothetical protein